MKNYRLIGLSLAALSLFAFASLEGCSSSTDTDGDTDGGADGSTTTDGSSGSAGTAGTSGDGGTDSAAGTRGGGAVSATYTEISGSQNFTLSAAFTAPDANVITATSGCTTTTEGDCTVTECTIETSDASSGDTDAGTTEPPNAGDIKITGGGFPSAGVTISTITDADAGPLKGTYEAKTLTSTEPWNASNKSMTVTAAGGTIPAFTKDLTAPLIVTATAPSFAAGTSLARANDLAVTWTDGTGSGGKVVFSLLSASSTKSVVATCSFDPAAGTGTVKSAVLGKFDAGASVVGSIQTISSEVVAAGDYDVSINLSSTAKAGSSLASGTFTIP